MNIQTVADNLRNTIAGKEQHLAAMRTQTESLSSGWHAIVGMLEINIAELKRILQDVEQCQDDDYLKKTIEQSWRDNPDRSGGQFTDEEINRAGEWR